MSKSWQLEMLDQLVLHLKKDEDILGLVLFGSGSQPETGFDAWSDIDLLLVVGNHSLGRFFPTLRWIQPFGEVFTYSQSSDHHKSTTRVCFENMNRVDFVITTQDQLAEVDCWQGIPFRNGVEILFSRAGVVDRLAGVVETLSLPPVPLPPIPTGAFQDMVRDFRFKSMLAVYKVVRDDLLIALHLTQDLLRDCCVLGMMLRDRATGTNIHKSGSTGNQTAKALQTTQHPYTSTGLLKSIQDCQTAFDELAREWSHTYEPNPQPLMEWIDKAKKEITYQ